MTTELHEERLQAVCEVVRNSAARRVIDMGCGDGDLIVRLLEQPQIEKLLGIELSAMALQQLRVRLDNVSAEDLCRVELQQGSMLELPMNFSGFDCAVMLETIEHIDPRHLSVLERALFERMRAATIVITTPNAEYNPLLGLPPDRFRHPGHRFEWTRARFRSWAEGVAQRHGYQLSLSDLGGWHPDYGGASQMAVFRHR